MEYFCRVYRNRIIGLIVLCCLFEHAYELSQILFSDSDDQCHVLRSEIGLEVDHLPVEQWLINLFEILQEVDEVACNLEVALTYERHNACLLCVLKLCLFDLEGSRVRYLELDLISVVLYNLFIKLFLTELLNFLHGRLDTLIKDDMHRLILMYFNYKPFE